MEEPNSAAPTSERTNDGALGDSYVNTEGANLAGMIRTAPHRAGDDRVAPSGHKTELSCPFSAQQWRCDDRAACCWNARSESRIDNLSADGGGGVASAL